jgi:uncharacterized protein with FMN-binding domain
VRKGTKSFVSILSLGLIAAGYQAGQAAETSTGFTAAAAATGTTSAGSETLNTPAAVSTPIPSESATATPAATAAPAKSTTPSSTTKVSAASPAPVSTPKATAAAPAPAPVSTPAEAAPAATGTTKTGSAINYRFGTIQVSVTKANGKITAVNLLQAGATGGRQAAFSYLVQYAIQANGTSFGNLGGATYTTDAFKQSLESALAKF